MLGWLFGDDEGKGGEAQQKHATFAVGTADGASRKQQPQGEPRPYNPNAFITAGNTFNTLSGAGWYRIACVQG